MQLGSLNIGGGTGNSNKNLFGSNTGNAGGNTGGNTGMSSFAQISSSGANAFAGTTNSIFIVGKTMYLNF